MNLPNKLTLMRVILIPFFLVMIYVDAIPLHFLWALVIFAAASLTDMLDGKIARARGLVTNFGKFLDPLADKVLVITALTVFVELKKKYESVVYKRRIAMTEDEAERYLLFHEKVKDTQITREIDYCLKNYKKLAPAVMLSYEREAFYAKDDHEFRITFDQNILWRNYDLSLCRGIYGEAILAKNKVLMEVKTAGAIPLWMVHFLTENQIYKTSFSKYATAYRTIYEREKRSCPPENFFVFTGDEVVQQAIKC